MKISVDNLIIETTRRCNMRCKHCLRGEAQKKDIDLFIIDQALMQIDNIYSLTFTGGEPSMNVPAINHTLEKCRELSIGIGSFYIATNGKNISEEFVLTCLRLYSYSEEKDMCQVSYSNDQYHTGGKDTELLSGLSFFHNRYEKGRIDSLIFEGRAVSLNSPGRMNIENSEINTKEDFREIQIYLNCRGEIINGCDWSYKNQKKHKLCNVSELTNFYNTLKDDDEND